MHRPLPESGPAPAPCWRPPRLPLLLVAGLLLAASPSAADVISFEELAASNDPQVALSDEYLLDWGVLFSGGDGAVWNGTSDGDPGGWGLDGSNGPSFLGLDGPTYSVDVGFDVVVQDFQLDVGLAEGSGVFGVVLTGFLDGVAVEQLTTAFAPVGEWKTLTLTADVDSVRVSGLGVGRYAVDNLRWVGPERPEPDPEPEPEPEPQVHRARVDLNPSSDDNRVKLPPRGYLVVLLFGDADLDVMGVDQDSLAFGPGAAPDKTRRWRHRLVHDFDEDGHLDLVAMFRTSRVGVSEEAQELCLTGVMEPDGQAFEGCDAVRPVARERGWGRWWGRRHHGGHHDDDDSDSDRHGRRR